MQADLPIVFILLPLALVIIMLGLGLSLRAQDFRNVLDAPKAVIVALIFQTLVLPAACLAVIYAFGLEPALAVGMMLLAASPGGTSSTIYSHLANGDVALNVTLTAINSILAIVTMPLIVNFSLGYFFEGDQAIPLQFIKMLQVFAIMIVPMVVGMLLRWLYPAFADRMGGPVKFLSALFLVTVLAIALVHEWETLKTWAPLIGLAVLTFNLISLVVGYFGPLAAGIGKRQAIAIGLEIGIHNAALAMAIALSPTLLNNPTMAIPAAIYGLIAYVTAAVYTYLLKRRHGPAAGQAAGNVPG